MSTAPNAVVAPNPIQQGVALYKERIRPAKLDESTNHNGLFFGRYIHAKGLNANKLSPKQISDLLYQATVEDCEKEKPEIKWSTPPKALTKRASLQNKPTKVADPREASTFESKVRESEKADVERKAQEQAKKRCLGLVERFAPIKRGRLVYELRDSKQKEWREQIAKAGDFEKLEKAIIQEQTAIYDKLERAEQRL